jgi:hypothetical protein
LGDGVQNMGSAHAPSGFAKDGEPWLAATQGPHKRRKYVTNRPPATNTIRILTEHIVTFYSGGNGVPEITIGYS